MKILTSKKKVILWNIEQNVVPLQQKTNKM